MPREERKKTALRAVAYSALILLASIVIGQLLLAALEISLASFQIAGGIVLFLFGLQMVFGKASGIGECEELERGRDVAVFPLAVPSIVGPEAILAVILLTDNHLYPLVTQLMTAGVVLVVLAATYLLMRLADPVLRILGEGGIAILERIMGMLLTALAVEFVLSALPF